MQQNIYHNGNIITLDENNPSPPAMLTRDGTIHRFANTEQLMQWAQGGDLFNLQSGYITPAFIDTHSHLTSAAASLCLIDLSDCHSRNDVVQTLYQAQNERIGGWIIGRGYDNLSFDDQMHPTLSELNEVSDTIPVLAVHVSGHIAAANTAALSALSYTPGSTLDNGGSISEYGLLSEGALMSPHARNVIPSPSLSELLRGIELAQKIYLDAGYRTICDAKVASSDLSLLCEAEKSGILMCDVICYLDYDYAVMNPEKVGFSSDRLRVAGVKIFLDGSPQAKTAFMSEPYKEPPEGKSSSYTGISTMTDERLFEIIRNCESKGWQIQAHANGDAAISQFIRVLRQICPTGTSLRHTLIHCQCATQSQLEDMSALKLIPSFFIDHVYRWGDYYKNSIFDTARAERISPAGTALSLGLPFTFHSDFPVLTPDPLLTIRTAVTRMTESGDVLGESERISWKDALRALTVNAAFQLGLEKEKGTLAENKKAELHYFNASQLSSLFGEESIHAAR